MSTDRTVHATTPAWEIVRYDRAGHWYAETTRGLPRRKLTIGEAVRLATEVGSEVHLGRPGGRRFDSLVAQRLAERWQGKPALTRWEAKQLDAMDASERKDTE